jgi:hypothetical protein
VAGFPQQVAIGLTAEYFGGSCLNGQSPFAAISAVCPSVENTEETS